MSSTLRTLPRRRIEGAARASRTAAAAVFAAALLLAAAPARPAAADTPSAVLDGVPFRYRPAAEFREEFRRVDLPVTIAVDGNLVFSGTASGILEEPPLLTVRGAGTHTITVRAGGETYATRVRAINGLWSLLPPLVAILFALVFRQVIVALLAGIWLGSMILSGWRTIPSLLRIVDHYVVETLAGPASGTDHISIIVFTLLLGGMVGVTSRMGGMQGIVNRISRLATTPRRGQLTVWLMGLAIFFDDYTNTLIVGNSTRPLTDRLGISREKLSYIVDSTAAPVASLAVITSWIGFQISLIDQSFASIGVERNPLAVFVAALPYSFYPLLAVLFVLLVIVTGRDFSLMHAAERRARETGKVSSDEAVPLSDLDAESIAPDPGVRPLLVNGVLPIVSVIVVTFAGLIVTGRAAAASAGAAQPTILEALRESNSFTALLWGSFSGCLVAAGLALSQRLLSLTATVQALVDGIRSMMTAIIILVLAWSIGMVCTEIRTADYLVHHLSGFLSPRLLPTLVFLLAIGISFSTGTSWGTMSILTPIVIPLVFGASAAAGLAGAEFEPILLASIAAILSGAVFGDHCSPISDTTIMSSMASGADHVDHIRTQLPYALTVGLVALVLGYLLTAAGVPVIVCLLAASISLAAVIGLAGAPTDPPRR